MSRVHEKFAILFSSFIIKTSQLIKNCVKPWLYANQNTGTLKLHNILLLVLRHISNLVSSRLLAMHGRPPAQFHSNFKRRDDETIDLGEKSCKRILVAGAMTLVMVGIMATLVGGIIMAVTEAGKQYLKKSGRLYSFTFIRLRWFTQPDIQVY